MSADHLKRNIPLDYLFVFSSNLNLTHGIWMIFLASRGFSLLQIGIMESVFHITSFLMEVPTGIVADLWGRKISRLAGRVFFLISLVLMFWGTRNWVQITGFVFCALGYNLESGAGEALVYDSLKLLGRKEKFMRVKGIQEFLFQASNILAFLAGGYLAVSSYGTAFGFTGIMVLVSLGIGFFFREAKAGSDNGAVKVSEEEDTFVKRALGSMKEQTLGSLKVIRKQPKIAFLILFSEIIFVFYTTVFFYLQNYWKNGGLTEWDIGIIYALQCAVSAVTGLYAARIEKLVGERGILLLGPVFLVVGLWGIALTRFSAPFFIAGGIVEGLLIVAVSDYINRMIPSEYRATILSFQSMCFSMGMIFLFPLFGWLADYWSMTGGFIIIASLASVGGAFFIFRVFYRTDRNREIKLPGEEPGE